MRRQYTARTLRSLPPLEEMTLIPGGEDACVNLHKRRAEETSYDDNMQASITSRRNAFTRERERARRGEG